MLRPSHNGHIVPWTTPWTGEDNNFHLKVMHFAPNLPSVCQRNAPGQGTPVFTSQHYQRQRQAIVMGRCDVCGGMIRPGQSRVLLAPGEYLKGTDEIGHVMAPSHRECARQSALVCPWIIKKIEDGTLSVSVVVRYRTAIAILDPDVVEAETGIRRKAYGHAKLIVDKSLNRNADWLMKEQISS